MLIDVVIAGAGPGGLSAALCLARAGRQVLVLDGGSWRNVSSDRLHNFLSRDGVTPSELRATALAQLSRYPCVKVQPVSAEAVDGESGDFRVMLSDGRVIQARRLVLATGVDDVLPGISGLAERWGHSVVHCPYCHGWERAGQTLGVLALNEWAVPQAVHVQRFSDDVTLYTNGEPVMTADQQDLLKARGVSIREGQLARLEDPGRRWRGSCLQTAAPPPVRDCSATRPPVSAAISPPGSAAACSTTMRSRSTNSARPTRPGVYAVGDMARTAANPFTPHQIAAAAAQGSVAGVIIDQELLYSD